MNKVIIIIGIVILVLIGGGLYNANQKSEQAKMASEKAAMEEKKATDEVNPYATKTQEQIAMEKQKAMTDKNINARYVPYSKAAYDESADKRRVLYFYATWCPSCKIANEDFTANPNKIPEDVIVIRINYNDPDTDQEEKDLAKKYGITYQHTFVQVDAQGKELTKWNGGQTDELVTNIK